MSWLHTYSGRKFDPLSPRAEDVDMEDVAHALSMTCRFAGHSRRYYSVAQHSCYVSDVAEEIALMVGKTQREIGLISAEALIHDASEFVICDVPSPVKPFFVVDGRPYKEWEEQITVAVRNHLGLPTPSDETKAIVKQADLILLKLEAEQLMHGVSEYKFDLPDWQTFDLAPMNWEEAKAMFLHRLSGVKNFLRLYA